MSFLHSQRGAALILALVMSLAIMALLTGVLYFVTQATTVAHGHILQYREVWRADGYRITFCLDSLSALLEANEPEAVFQFAHILSKRLEAVDAVAHFHVDPDADDEALVRTFEQIFDELFIEFEADESTVVGAGGSGRATDTDVARSTAHVAEDAEEPAGTAPHSSSEATDDDIADALGDS